MSNVVILRPPTRLRAQRPTKATAAQQRLIRKLSGRYRELRKARRPHSPGAAPT